MKKCLATIAFFGGMTAVSANAQAPEEAALEPFAKCENIAEPAERLSCFDAALVKAKSLAVASREQRRARTRDDFGLTAFEIEKQDAELAENDPNLVQERREQRTELEPNQIESELVDFYVGNASKKRIFVLKNGQIWQETRPNSLGRSPRAGMKIVISKSGFGGFRLKIGDRKGSLSVKRLR